jgi:hypothetical protein
MAVATLPGKSSSQHHLGSVTTPPKEELSPVTAPNPRRLLLVADVRHAGPGVSATGVDLLHDRSGRRRAPLLNPAAYQRTTAKPWARSPYLRLGPLTVGPQSSSPNYDLENHVDRSSARQIRPAVLVSPRRPRDILGLSTPGFSRLEDGAGDHLGDSRRFVGALDLNGVPHRQVNNELLDLVGVHKL